MHDLYMLALQSTRNRARAAPKSRLERVRDEQAFYDAHTPAPKSGRRRNLAIPLVFVASASLVGLAHLLVR